jgi:hypothetical protein
MGILATSMQNWQELARNGAVDEPRTESLGHEYYVHQQQKEEVTTL